jgi:hypothetical protein
MMGGQCSALVLRNDSSNDARVPLLGEDSNMMLAVVTATPECSTLMLPLLDLDPHVDDSICPPLLLQLDFLIQIGTQL